MCASTIQKKRALKVLIKSQIMLMFAVCKVLDTQVHEYVTKHCKKAQNMDYKVCLVKLQQINTPALQYKLLQLDTRSSNVDITVFEVIMQHFYRSQMFIFTSSR